MSIEGDVVDKTVQLDTKLLWWRDEKKMFSLKIGFLLLRQQAFHRYVGLNSREAVHGQIFLCQYS